MHTTEVRAAPNEQPAMRWEVRYFHNRPAQVESSSGALHFWIRSELLSELQANRSVQAQIKGQFSSVIAGNFAAMSKDCDSRDWKSPRKGQCVFRHYDSHGGTLEPPDALRFADTSVGDD
jgi:hypothetical protein